MKQKSCWKNLRKLHNSLVYNDIRGQGVIALFLFFDRKNTGSLSLLFTPISKVNLSSYISRPIIQKMIDPIIQKVIAIYYIYEVYI